MATVLAVLTGWAVISFGLSSRLSIKCQWTYLMMGFGLLAPGDTGGDWKESKSIRLYLPDLTLRASSLSSNAAPTLDLQKPIPHQGCGIALLMQPVVPFKQSVRINGSTINQLFGFIQICPRRHGRALL